MSDILNNEINQPSFPETHTLHLTLEEMYNGTIRYIDLINNFMCTECMGNGSRRIVQDFDICEQCNGTSPGCKLCCGSGLAIIRDSRCHTCKGAKLVSNPTVLAVKITPGMWHGQKLVYRGEGTQGQRHVLVILQEIGHHLYKRQGNDLLLAMPLNFNEAFYGCEKSIITLNNRQLAVSVFDGSKNNDGQCFLGEGMPFYDRPHIKGKLVVRYQVKEPMDTVEEIMARMDIND